MIMLMIHYNGVNSTLNNIWRVLQEPIHSKRGENLSGGIYSNCWQCSYICILILPIDPKLLNYLLAGLRRSIWKHGVKVFNCDFERFSLSRIPSDSLIAIFEYSLYSFQFWFPVESRFWMQLIAMCVSSNVNNLINMPIKTGTVRLWILKF